MNEPRASEPAPRPESGRPTPRHGPPLIAACALLLALVATGCGGPRQDPMLLLSSDEALDQGKALMDREKYARARRFLEHAFEASPNSRSGREALLLVGDALYLQGSNENFIRCEAKYRDFLNRFPTSDRADYAQFQVGNCLARRIERADRDQKATHEALEAFEELLRLYPTSSYVVQAQEQIIAVTNNLAEHEFVIGDFHRRFRLCKAAIDRLEPIPASFPQYDGIDKVLYHLGLSYEQCRQYEDARNTLEQLARDHPGSSYLPDAQKALERIARQPAPEEPEEDEPAP